MGQPDRHRIAPRASASAIAGLDAAAAVDAADQRLACVREELNRLVILRLAGLDELQQRRYGELCSAEEALLQVVEPDDNEVVVRATDRAYITLSSSEVIDARDALQDR